jgi:hypothetical protein
MFRMTKHNTINTTSINMYDPFIKTQKFKIFFIKLVNNIHYISKLYIMQLQRAGNYDFLLKVNLCTLQFENDLITMNNTSFESTYKNRCSIFTKLESKKLCICVKTIGYSPLMKK